MYFKNRLDLLIHAYLSSTYPMWPQSYLDFLFVLFLKLDFTSLKFYLWPQILLLLPARNEGVCYHALFLLK